MVINRSIKSLAFWIATSIVLVAILLILATYFRWFRLTAELGGESVHHWFSYSGTAFIGIYLPLYSFLKRRYTSKQKLLLYIHVFGNLLAFSAISIHFTHQLTRPAQAYPDLGTGVALITTLVILIITGFVLRFQLIGKGLKSWRWVHTGLILSFYLIIVLHILHGLGAI